MADDQSNSGGAFNPFAEEVPRVQNEPAAVDPTAKLDEIKEDVVKKRRRRRSRRKKVFGGEGGGESTKVNPTATAQHNQQKDADTDNADDAGDESDDFPDEPPADGDDGAEDDFEDEMPHSVPVNPFENLNVPPPQEEPRHKAEKLQEEKKKEEEKKPEAEKIVQDESATDDYGEPINPFDAAPVSEHVPGIDTKALEDKPMDRRDDAVAFSPFEEESSSEIPAFSEEQVAETGGVEENFFAAKNDNVKEDVVAEAEIVSREETPNFENTPSPPPEADQQFNQDVQEFKQGFWSILEQAGITKKHLIGFGIAFLVIISVILFFVFGGMSLFRGDGQEVEVVEEDVEKDVVEDEPEVVDEPVSSSAAVQGQPSDAYGLVTSYLVGQKNVNQIKTPIVVSSVTSDIAGIDTALLIGIGEQADKIRYQYYIGLLRKLLNIYQTDVYALVDLALDRRQALDAYLEEMNALIGDADGALIEINAIMNDIDARFEKVAEEKAFLEAEYFATTEALLTESSYNNLMEYVRVTQDADKLKGFYNAYSFLRDMYNNALLRIKPRYKDIVLNKDAVVAGVRVFDVPSSDIKAIIRLAE